MITLDSSGWLEMLASGPRAESFQQRLNNAEAVVVPAVVLYEVYKVTKRKFSEEEAKRAVAKLRSYRFVPLDDRLALEAADFSLEHHLSMADAIVYATARAYEATLVTGDAHFADLPGVEYIELVQ